MSDLQCKNGLTFGAIRSYIIEDIIENIINTMIK
jgi:hypothetical protein